MQEKVIRPSTLDRLEAIADYLSASTGSQGISVEAFYTLVGGTRESCAKFLERCIYSGLMRRAAFGVYMLTDLGQKVAGKTVVAPVLSQQTAAGPNDFTVHVRVPAATGIQKLETTFTVPDSPGFGDKVIGYANKLAGRQVGVVWAKVSALAIRAREYGEGRGLVDGVYFHFTKGGTDNG